ncbi:sulfur carrier protein ThiS [Hydrogenivirga sp. 128-5-R1-1]|uniref:sulfur carrier protein ThiS n=1 Tax=Hydrogenivirga sp. 128-5-R1-1 TaxID=392423 RepID=UPI00015EF948|nr:sulfur carrier protein ThiS [Hydrogenivirga sp. 128-5-R1-1]EDP74557.1 thiamine biosynthesis protein ThiS [Hydrogenivirga sp. 128-5-R1-1]
MPRITVNGKDREVSDELTIMELLELMDVKFREVGLAVAVNDEVVPKSEYKTRRVKEGDKVEIVQLVGGG